MFSHACKWLKVGALALAAGGAWAAYQDPLDVPARTVVRPEAGQINAVAAAGKRIVAIGRRGVIVYSDDGGQRWSQAAVPVSVDFTAMHFPTPEVGWVVGHGGVLLQTSDGGKTWAKRLDGRLLGKLLTDHYAQQSGDVANAAKAIAAEGPIHPFLDVWFESEQVGYVIGAFNLILRTEDGGKTWEPWFDRTDNPKGLHLYSVRGAGGEVYIAAERGLVMRLDKAAKRFVAVPTPYQGSYFRVVVRPDNVMVFGLRGNAFRSDDGGKNWQPLDATVKTALTASDVMGDGRVILGTQGGDILVGTSRGENFTAVNGAKRMPLAAVVPVGPDTVAYGGLTGVGVLQLKK